MVQGVPDDQGVLPIVQLVRNVVAGSGLSLRSFADERRIAYSTLRYYHDKRRKPLSQPPRQETLRELALALDQPLGDIEQAALESLSYRAAPPRQPSAEPVAPKPRTTIEDAIENDRSLHPAAKAHLLNQLELLRLVPHDAVIPVEEQTRRREAVKRDQATIKLLPEPAPLAPRKGSRK